MKCGFLQDIIIDTNIDIENAAPGVCFVQPDNAVIRQRNRLIGFFPDIVQQLLLGPFRFRETAFMPCRYCIDKLKKRLFSILFLRYKIMIYRNQDFNVLLLGTILCKQNLSGRLQTEAVKILLHMTYHKRELLSRGMQLI